MRKVLFLACIVFFCACNSNNDQSDSSKNRSNDSVATTSTPSQRYMPSTSPTYNLDSDDDENSDDDTENNSAIQGGTYSATVDYYNPSTGYSATYTLDVEVEDGEVVQIDFPNGGYLDNDHITPAEIDKDGTAVVEGEEGKTYTVHIEP